MNHPSDRKSRERLGQLVRLNDTALFFDQTGATANRAAIGHVERAKEAVDSIDHGDAVAATTFEHSLGHEQSSVVLPMMCTTHAKCARAHSFDRPHAKYVDMRHGFGRSWQVGTECVLPFARLVAYRHGEWQKIRLAQCDADNVGCLYSATSLAVFAGHCGSRVDTIRFGWVSEMLSVFTATACTAHCTGSIAELNV